jgi:hypothetical protein
MVQTFIFIGYSIFEWITFGLYIRIIYILLNDKLFKEGAFYYFIIILGISVKFIFFN